MTATVVKVNFFGAFRKYGDHEMISLPAGSNVEDLKRLLTEHLHDSLVQDSAIACNDTIVDARYQIRVGEIISVLPPVCGG